MAPLRGLIDGLAWSRKSDNGSKRLERCPIPFTVSSSSKWPQTCSCCTSIFLQQSALRFMTVFVRRTLPSTGHVAANWSRTTLQGIRESQVYPVKDTAGPKLTGSRAWVRRTVEQLFLQGARIQRTLHCLDHIRYRERTSPAPCPTALNASQRLL